MISDGMMRIKKFYEKWKLQLLLSVVAVGSLCFLPAWGQTAPASVFPKDSCRQDKRFTPDFLQVTDPHEAVTDTVRCVLSVYLPKEPGNRIVRLSVVSDRRPDCEPPVLIVDGMTLECRSRSSSYQIKDGVESRSYAYWYTFEPASNGSFICRTRQLTFGGVSYDDKLLFSVSTLKESAGSNLSQGMVLLLIAVSGGLAWLLLWCRYHREADVELAPFVLRTHRLPLTVEWAFTHYSFPLVLLSVALGFLLAPFFMSLDGGGLYFWMRWWGFILFLLLSGVLICFIQSRRLLFRAVETALDAEEIFKALAQVGEKYRWVFEHAGPDCLVLHTTRTLWTPTWGEQIFVVFDDGRIWLNSVNDLTKRSCLFPFGRTERNMRRVEEAVRRWENGRKDAG